MYNIPFFTNLNFSYTKNTLRVKVWPQVIQKILRILSLFPFICTNKFSFIKISLKDLHYFEPVLPKWHVRVTSTYVETLYNQKLEFIYFAKPLLLDYIILYLFLYDADIYSPSQLFCDKHGFCTTLQKYPNEKRKYRKFLKFNKF